jgi:hypothetical protein
LVVIQGEGNFCDRIYRVGAPQRQLLDGSSNFGRRVDQAQSVTFRPGGTYRAAAHESVCGPSRQSRRRTISVSIEVKRTSRIRRQFD